MGANTEIEQVGVMCTDDMESVPRLEATAIMMICAVWKLQEIIASRNEEKASQIAE
jgi:hypothetical protein